MMKRIMICMFYTMAGRHSPRFASFVLDGLGLVDEGKVRRKNRSGLSLMIQKLSNLKHYQLFLSFLCLLLSFLRFMLKWN